MNKKLILVTGIGERIKLPDPNKKYKLIKRNYLPFVGGFEDEIEEIENESKTENPQPALRESGVNNK